MFDLICWEVNLKVSRYLWGGACLKVSWKKKVYGYKMRFSFFFLVVMCCHYGMLRTAVITSSFVLACRPFYFLLHVQRMVHGILDGIRTISACLLFSFASCSVTRGFSVQHMAVVQFTQHLLKPKLYLCLLACFFCTTIHCQHTACFIPGASLLWCGNSKDDFYVKETFEFP